MSGGGERTATFERGSTVEGVGLKRDHSSVLDLLIFFLKTVNFEIISDFVWYLYLYSKSSPRFFIILALFGFIISSSVCLCVCVDILPPPISFESNLHSLLLFTWKYFSEYLLKRRFFSKSIVHLSVLEKKKFFF